MRTDLSSLIPRVCAGGKDESCRRPVPEEAPVPLCTLHLLCAVQFAAEITPDLTFRALGPVADRLIPERKHRPMLPIPHNLQVVYFIRFQDAIKIGTSTDFPKRMKDLIHDEVLAIEPGGLAQERLRHREFAQFRKQREWFEAKPPILDLTVKLRSVYGEPFTAWDAWRRAEVQKSA